MAKKQPTVAHRATTSRTVDLNRVDAFVRVIEAGSFTAAARGSDLPKSSLSRAVKKLERELGVLLVLRTTRKLTLTEAGQLYFERAQGALSSLAEARDQLLEAGSEPRGRVRMTAPSGPTIDGLSRALAEFTRLYPHIEVDCTLTQRRLDLVAEGIDLALRAGVLDDSSLQGRKLGDSPLALYAAPAYLAQRGKPRRLAELARHDCVLFRGSSGTTRWTLDGARGRESVEVHGPLAVDEMAYALALAVCGAGIALLPTNLAKPSLERGELIRVLPKLQQKGGAIYLVHPATRHLPRRVALLRDHLYAALRPLFADG